MTRQLRRDRRGARSTQRPYTFGWNAPAEQPGEYRLEARAVGDDERTVSSAAVVTVASD